MQLRHYTWVVLHWLWLILLGTLICAGATYVISKRMPPVYEASAFIQVNDVGSAGNSGVFSNQAVAVSDALEITNYDVLQEASKKIPGATVDDLQTAVSASPVDNTQLIQVRADAHDAHQAADIANTVASVFIQRQIAQQSAIDQNAALKLSQELDTAKTNVDNAQAQLTKLENAQAPQDQIAHQRDVLNSFQSNYDALSTSYNQIQLHKSLLDNSLTVSQSAIPPTTAKGPRILLNTAIAAAMALLLTIAFALFLDWLDTTIKTSEDVAQLAMLEPLGSVPITIRSKDKSLLNDAATEQAFVIISTSFRVLSRRKRSILVTGLRASAGTSTTASGLAYALTQSGLRVMLVDANLHLPMQHVTFDFPNTRGLTNSLDNVETLPQQPACKDAWLKQWVTSVPNLYLLPAGARPKYVETIELVSKLQMLTEWLLQPNVPPFGTDERAVVGARASLQSWVSTSPFATADEMISGAIDMIIFDAPALNEGADAIALAPVTDGTLLVIEAGKEHPGALRKAQATLQRLGSPVIGVVVNRQRRTHRTYFYANRLQQGTVSSENSLTSSASKYPLLQTRANPLQELPETPLSMHAPQTRGATFDSDTTPRATTSFPDSPDTITVKVHKTPDATSGSTDPSQIHGSRLSDNQDGQAR